MTCPCGQELNETITDPYSHVKYEGDKMVYAVCVHGHLVINNTGNWEEDFNKD